jgi:hypothetical protein
MVSFLSLLLMVSCVDDSWFKEVFHRYLQDMFCHE